MTTDAPVIVASYPARHRADAVAEGLRGNRIGAAAIPSAKRVGAWDVVVRPDNVERASALVESLHAR